MKTRFKSFITIAKVSEYIRTLNNLTQQHHLSTVKSDEEVISKQAQLVIEEIERSLIYLKASSTCVVSLLKNDDLKQRKSLLESQSKEVKGISNKLKELIGLQPKYRYVHQPKAAVGDSYTSTLDYQLRIESEIKAREFDKHESFKKSRLNIKLSTFTGYDADIDIYSFIDEFEKLYSDSVPLSLQAELLKNNHLAKQALSLVKNIDSISEIWERLKRVFGDKEVLFQHKLSELYLINDSKQKDSMKIIEFLSKLTNSMRDLIQLASKHNIENELFYSDGFSRIVNNLGNNRMLRWLNISCEQPKDGKQK